MAERAVMAATGGPQVDHRSSTLMLLLTRLVTPLWFVIVALFQIRRGESSIPYWMNALTGKAQIAPELVLRVMIGVELAGACIMFLHGRWARRTALTLLMAACFVAIAEISAIGFKLESLVPAVLLVVSVPLLIGIGTGSPGALVAKAGVPQIVATLGAVAVACVLAARVPLTPNPAAPAQSATGPQASSGPPEPASTPAPTVSVPGERQCEIAAEKLPNEFFFASDLYPDVDVRQAKLLQFLPEDLAARLGTGRHYLILYSLSKEAHQFFDELLHGIDKQAVIAVRVPRRPQAGPDVDAGLGPVSCEGCDFVALPSGPFWFGEIPSLIRIDDGKVTCVTTGLDELAIDGCLHGTP